MLVIESMIFSYYKNKKMSNFSNLKNPSSFITSMQPRVVDCLIIGAGPTGLTLGLCLRKQGKSVAIAENKQFPPGFARAVFANSATLQVFEKYGVAEALCPTGVPVDGATIFMNERILSSSKFKSNEPKKHHHPPPMLLEQSEIEKCLRTAFLEAGGEIMSGYWFNQNENSFDERATGPFDIQLQCSAAECPTSPQTYVRCSWVFGCDGKHSAVRDCLQVGFPGVNCGGDGYMMDAVVEAWTLPTAVCSWYGVQGGFRFAAHVSNSPITARVVAANKNACLQLLTKFSVKQIAWESKVPNAFHVADAYGRGNAWLVGDACHLYSPLGGRGLNMGVQEAVLLGAAVEKGVLRAYESECHPVAQRWVRRNRLLSSFVLGDGWFAAVGRFWLCTVLFLLSFVLGDRLSQMMFDYLVDDATSAATTALLASTSTSASASASAAPAGRAAAVTGAGAGLGSGLASGKAAPPSTTSTATATSTTAAAAAAFAYPFGTKDTVKKGAGSGVGTAASLAKTDAAVSKSEGSTGSIASKDMGGKSNSHSHSNSNSNGIGLPAASG
jgi:2-polyprenyl-6-methoxyphenol hydroxylase-like FAD-dependent oxidoreductase